MLERVQLGLLGMEASAANVEHAVTTASREHMAGIVVPPSLLGAARAAEDHGLIVVALAGFPTGKHHTLVKASEARLAVQYGAAEVAVVADPVTARSDRNALLSEIVAVREAVPHPVALSVLIEAALLDESQLAAFAETARLAGADRITVGTGYHHPRGADPADVSVLAGALGPESQLALSAVGKTDAVADLLEAGAERVIVSDLIGLVGE